MTHRSGARRHLAVVAGLAIALSCVSALSARPAVAETADELQAKIDASTAAYNEATEQIDSLQQKIDEQQKKIDEVQAALPEQRSKADDAIRSMYKMQQGTPGLVDLLLSSDNFMDFLSTFQYIDVISSDQLSQVSALAKMQSDLVSAQETLTAAKDQATKEQQAAAQSMSEAQASLDELNRQIAEQQAAEAAAKAQAEAEAAAKAQAEAQAAADAQAQAQAEAAAQAAAQAQQQAQQAQQQASGSQGSSNPGATDGSEVMTDGEWMLGKASAYDVADNTGGSATASGEALTTTSVTVAVPASQRYLLGRSVQIRYGGKTITARVTDTGGFASAGRVLDLAGGVWRAFGFSSPEDWGVRTVQYRFL